MSNWMKPNVRVEHKKFGRGTIISVSQRRIVIMFAGKKREFDRDTLRKLEVIRPVKPTEEEEIPSPPDQPPVASGTSEEPYTSPYHGFGEEGAFQGGEPVDEGMDLAEGQTEIARILSDGGVMSRQYGYAYRSAQFEMAQQIAHAIAEKSEFMAEAGTGTGKTFAYLIPSLLMSNRVIVSTQTNALQDQLLDDVKKVETVLGRKLKAAVLKGRDKYLCIRRVKESIRHQGLVSPAQFIRLHSISDNIDSGRFQSGQKGEIGAMTDELWNRIKCTSESCVDNCPHEKTCYFRKARAAAKAANIAIVNHSLFFINERLKAEDQDFESLLPDNVGAVIFDEAHHLPDTATEAYGDQITYGAIRGTLNDTLHELEMLGGEELSKWKDAADNIRHAYSNMNSFELRNFMRSQGKQSLERQEINATQYGYDLKTATLQLAGQLDGFAQALKQRADRSDTLKKYVEKINSYSSLLGEWIHFAFEEEDFWRVIWIDFKDNALILKMAPLSVRKQLRNSFDNGKHAWIFTSATISTRNSDNQADFSYFARQMSLDQAERQTWQSPFNYADIGRLYIPTARELPFVEPPGGNKPINDRMRFWQSMVTATLPLIHECRGGTFILCTSNKAVNTIGSMIRQQLGTRPVFIQDNTDKAKMIERFKQAGNGVLVGTRSFWEGVDVPGNALSLVVIERLPFNPLTPLFNARTRLAASQGNNSYQVFQRLSLPECLITLKQGAGRLIRSESDKGLLMVCDRRIENVRTAKAYRKDVINSLPSFREVNGRQEAIDFLREIAT